MFRKFNSGSTRLWLTILFFCLATAGSATGQTQQCGEVNTATGQPGWTLVSGPGVSAPKQPVNVSPYPGWQSTPLPGSSWVSTDANRGGASGDYTYEFSFCLCKEGKHALSLSFYADNGATVFLDSTQIFATTGSYNFNGAAKVVNYSWPGSAGVAKIRIVVRNDSGPTGLNAVLRISGATAGDCCGRAANPKDWRSTLTEKITAEAARLGLRVQGDYSVQANGNALLVVVEVAGGNRGVRAPRKGTTRLAYIEGLEGQQPADVPNGFYFIQSSPGLAKILNAKLGDNSGALADQSLTFVSTDGQIKQEVPVVAGFYYSAIPRFRHYWTRLPGGFWIDGEPE